MDLTETFNLEIELAKVSSKFYIEKRRLGNSYENFNIFQTTVAVSCMKS